MGAATSRLLVALVLAGSAAHGAAAAPVPPLPPPCTGHVAARFTDAATTGNVHAMTVVLTATGNACTLAGFADLVLPSAQAAPLPVGHVTLAQPVVLAAGSPAAFRIRYVTSQAPAAEPCSLSVTVNGVPDSTEGTLPFAACASVTRIDVTGYARGTQGPFEAGLVASNAQEPPCQVPDLALREIRTAPPGALAADAIYALQNRGRAPCTVVGALGIRLFGADGNAFALRFGVRNAMAMVITLAPEHEASFTVGYAPPAPAQCPVSTRIEVIVATQAAPLRAPATLMGCTGPRVRVSNLRDGVPLANGIASR
jgi:hypothetical protein